MCDGLWVSDDHPEQVNRVRHQYFAEHWKMGAIAAERGLDHETVRSALETDRFNRAKTLRAIQAEPHSMRSDPRAAG